MKQNNSKFGAIVGLATVIITQMILSSLGVNGISTIIYITFLAVAGTVFAFIMIKSKNNRFGKKNSVIAVILMSLGCITNIASMLLIRCYPQFGDDHKIIAIAIVLSGILTFFTVVIFWIVMAIRMFAKN